MISIRKNVSELERYLEERNLALDCYVDALRNAAHYAVEVDPQSIPAYRQYLNAVAGEVAKGETAVLVDSRATVRGLLRDYRDKASQYLARLRDELAGTARALQEITESLNQTDDDHEAQLRKALTTLRAVAGAAGNGLADTLSGAANAIEQSLEQLRRKNQITVSQFVTEIRMLHQRIDALESAASIDDLTKLFNHAEMENKIRSLSAGAYCLLLVRAGGLRMAAVNFGREVTAELSAAFTKRLVNSLPGGCVIGRWADEDFVAILHKSKTESVNHGKIIAEQLGGSYACLYKGKTVRPVLHLRVGVVDKNGDNSERILQRVAEFLPEK